MQYPISVYGWNRYSGEEPAVTSNGLPTTFAGANLPVVMPEPGLDEQANNDSLSYSPVLLEIGVGPNSAPTPNLPTTPTAQAAQAAPTKTQFPPLVNTIARAVFGGKISTSQVNSAASVASGASTLNTGS